MGTAEGRIKCLTSVCAQVRTAYQTKGIILGPMTGAGVLNFPLFVEGDATGNKSAIGNCDIPDEFEVISAILDLDKRLRGDHTAAQGSR